MKYCSYCGSPIDSIFDDKCEHCGEDLVIESNFSSNKNKSYSFYNNKYDKDNNISKSNIFYKTNDHTTNNYSKNNSNNSNVNKVNVFSKYSKYRDVYDENNNLLYKEITSFDDAESLTLKSLFKKNKTSKKYSDKNLDNHSNKSSTNNEKNLSHTYDLFIKNINQTCNYAYWNKNKYIAGLLAIFLGMFGAQKFYLGKYKIGVIYLVLGFTGIVGVIWLISLLEGFIYLFTPKEQFIEKYL